MDYPNEFYIVPKIELIERGIFSSSEHKGIVTIYIPLPENNTSKYFWIRDYLNRWDLLN